MCDQLLQDAIAVDLVVDHVRHDRLIEAESLLEKYNENHLFSGLSLCVLRFSRYALSMEEESLRKALETAYNLRLICKDSRKKFKIMSVIFMKTSSYDGYDGRELVAELIYHFTVLLETLLLISSEKSMKNIFKGGINIYKSFRALSQLKSLLYNEEIQLHSRFEHEKVYVNFRALILLATGVFDVILAVVPDNLINILSFIGMKNNLDDGVERLKEAVLSDSFVSTFSCLSYATFQVVLTQNCHICFKRDERDTQIEKIIHTYMGESSLFKYLEARRLQIRGDLSSAIKLYDETLQKDLDWPELKYIAYWELFWSYSIRGQLDQSLIYIDKLYRESRWSKAIFLYFRSITSLSIKLIDTLKQKNNLGKLDLEKLQPLLLNLKLKSLDDIESEPPRKSSESLKKLLVDNHIIFKDSDSKELKDILDDFKGIDPLIRVIFGKRMIDEKLASKRSKKFIKSNYIACPVYEILYLWNWFPYIAMDDEYFEIALINLQAEFLFISKSCSKSTLKDRILIKFLIASLLAQKKSYYAYAKILFKSIIKNDSKLISVNQFLLASSHYELADIYFNLENYSVAQHYIDDSRKFNHYLMNIKLLYKVNSLEKKLSQYDFPKYRSKYEDCQ